ncbi:MAG: hypothetical protein ACK5FE_14115 [Cyanobacteriota bacterium]
MGKGSEIGETRNKIGNMPHAQHAIEAIEANDNSKKYGYQQHRKQCLNS